jgi:hypothetical protein
MTIFIDYSGKRCFILSPKCGTQTLSKFLNLPLDIQYNGAELSDVLNDKTYKKIVVVRDHIERFLSGFYEDLKNNSCYLNLDIPFIDYIKFLYYCHNNKIPNVINTNVYNKDYNFIVEWGACSGKKLSITDENGKLSGHIISQIQHIKPPIDLLNDDDDVEVINMSELSKITNIHENSKSYLTSEELNYNYNTLLSDIKKNQIYPNSDKMINSKIRKMLDSIYAEDIEYINKIKQKFSI